jgi:L,D-peptidoglycan transpeptidase YkuD (ErfK/YbiS/YcfS/YnhG family)
MMREDGLYDVCLVMDWNLSSRRRNAGSAIFFHIVRPGYEPTEGCIAVSLPAMRRLIRQMRRGTIVEVV